MQIMIPVFIFSVLLFSYFHIKGEENQEAIHCYTLFVLSEFEFYLLTSISHLSCTGLCIGNHLNKTLDISELCLRLASGLQSDQEVGGRTRAITLVSQADTLWQKL